MLPVTAGAVWDDRVELFVSETIGYDDNLFRLSDEVDPVEVLGTSAMDDTYFTTRFGLELDLPVSRQNFSGSVSAERTRYDRFTALDLNGHRGNILWEWVVGSRLSGELEYTETETLASFANVLSGQQSSTPNFLTVQRGDGLLRYKLTERWYLTSGISRLTHDNSEEINQVSNLQKNFGEFGILYITPAETEFSINGLVSEAELPNRQLLDGQLIDNSYREYEYSANLDWPVSAESRILARAGTVRREHEELPERDFSGEVYALTWGWRPTEKLSLSLSSERSISPFEQVNVGFVLLDSLTFRSDWRITEKFTLTFSAIDGNRRYLGDPRAELTEQVRRTEDVRVGQLNLEYLPTSVLTLGIELRNVSRTSSAVLGDFDASIGRFTVRAGF
jgi:exopolysaccharide biosynthesis operon protein EpsL